jgi:ubiquinone/menaquinone biosynthesis C-methylase UbiE
LNTAFTMNSFRGKQILALVRSGDFAHAGEEEAIELTMAGIAKDPGRQLLDAGCGRGGTAAYLQHQGWGRVTGVDVEAESIDHARETYPDVCFVACDIASVADHPDRTFDVLTMFNVLYALPDHTRALDGLAQVAKPDARLVVFDYVDHGRYQDDPILDSGEPFLPNPPKLSEIPGTLAGAGWNLQDIEPIDEAYVRWYAALVAKIEAKRGAVEALAGAEGYAHVHGLYSSLLAALRSGRLGGAIIKSRRAA